MQSFLQGGGKPDLHNLHFAILRYSSLKKICTVFKSGKQEFMLFVSTDLFSQYTHFFNNLSSKRQVLQHFQPKNI
jgi:hypothetical protein